MFWQKSKWKICTFRIFLEQIFQCCSFLCADKEKWTGNSRTKALTEANWIQENKPKIKATTVIQRKFSENINKLGLKFRVDYFLSPSAYLYWFDLQLPRRYLILGTHDSLSCIPRENCQSSWRQDFIDSRWASGFALPSSLLIPFWWNNWHAKDLAQLWKRRK